MTGSSEGTTGGLGLWASNPQHLQRADDLPSTRFNCRGGPRSRSTGVEHQETLDIFQSMAHTLHGTAISAYIDPQNHPQLTGIYSSPMECLGGRSRAHLAQTDRPHLFRVIYSAPRHPKIHPLTLFRHLKTLAHPGSRRLPPQVRCDWTNCGWHPGPQSQLRNEGATGALGLNTPSANVGKICQTPWMA